jgi:hypothetical protein
VHRRVELEERNRKDKIDGLSKWAAFRIRKNEVVKDYCRALKLHYIKKKQIRRLLFRRTMK